jgi:alpha-glucosidase
MEDFGEGVPPQGEFADGTDATTTHNRWPVLYREVTAGAIAEHKPDAAGFARGYYTGAQAHAKAFWPGDQARDWSNEVGLGSIVAAGVSAGLMGIAAWGPDIAANVGYPAISPYGQGATDEELYLRWCELGAMTPVMREHLGFFTPAPVDLWSSEATIACWKRCATWHIRHFPYLYTLAHEATATGLPVLRGLMLEFPDDPLSWTVSQQFLLGGALLCAPVTRPGVTSREVYLPAGTWMRTGDGVTVEGGRWVDVPADLTTLPVLQRGATVVPLLADAPDTLWHPRFAQGAFDLELRVAAGDSTTTLFDGTRVEVRGDRVTVHNPAARRVVVADPTGRPLDEGSGTILTLTA